MLTRVEGTKGKISAAGNRVLIMPVTTDAESTRAVVIKEAGLAQVLRRMSPHESAKDTAANANSGASNNTPATMAKDPKRQKLSPRTVIPAGFRFVQRKPSIVITIPRLAQANPKTSQMDSEKIQEYTS